MSKKPFFIILFYSLLPTNILCTADDWSEGFKEIFVQLEQFKNNEKQHFISGEYKQPTTPPFINGSSSDGSSSEGKEEPNIIHTSNNDAAIKFKALGDKTLEAYILSKANMCDFSTENIRKTLNTLIKAIREVKEDTKFKYPAFSCIIHLLHKKFPIDLMKEWLTYRPQDVNDFSFSSTKRKIYHEIADKSAHQDLLQLELFCHFGVDISPEDEEKYLGGGNEKLIEIINKYKACKKNGERYPAPKVSNYSIDPPKSSGYSTKIIGGFLVLVVIGGIGFVIKHLSFDKKKKKQEKKPSSSSSSYTNQAFS